MHFVHQFQCFEVFLKCVFDFFKTVFFLKNFVSLYQLRLIQSIFWSIEIAFKIFMESLSISINRISRIRFIKNLDLTCWNHFFKNFSKLFLSVPLGKAPQQAFCRFPPNFLQSFSLHKPVCPYYPLFCIDFHVFMHYFMFFWVNFRTMYKLRFLMYQALFFEIDQWVLLLYWYIPNLWWLIWSIWGFVIN